MKIVFMGPCRKIDRAKQGLYPPFSPESRSGRFLRAMLDAQTERHVEIEFDNVIGTSVVDEAGKEYVPTPPVLARSLKNHRVWKSANIIVALGGNVKKAFEMVLGRRSNESRSARVFFLDHPSYVMRRPQTERDSFARQLREVIEFAGQTRNA